jgi:hypothetical protein
MLLKSDKLNARCYRHSLPADLTFLAMTQLSLGKKADSVAMLARLHDSMKKLPFDWEPRICCWKPNAWWTRRSDEGIMVRTRPDRRQTIRREPSGSDREGSRWIPGRRHQVGHCEARRLSFLKNIALTMLLPRAISG